MAEQGDTREAEPARGPVRPEAARPDASTPGTSAQPPPHNSSPPNYRLSIESGRHAGAIGALALGAYRIGRAAEADVVLTDEHLAPVHALVQLEIDSLRVEAVGGPVVVSAGDGTSARLAPGEHRSLSRDADIALGDTRLVLKNLLPPALPPPREEARPRRRWITALCVAAAILAPVSVYALGAGVIGWPHKQAPPLETARKVPPPAANTVADDRLEQAALQLQKRLADRGLADIEVRVSADTLIAAGAVDPARAADWIAVQNWFDETYAGHPVLVHTVALAPAQPPPPLSVQAVWTGPIPYIIAGSGEKYGEGALLDGGWVIERIESDRLVLNRDGRTLVLTY